MKIFLSSLENTAADKSIYPVNNLSSMLIERGIKMKWNLMSYYYLQKFNSEKSFGVRAILSSLAGKYVDGFIFTFIGLSFLPLETKIIMVINCPLTQIILETLLLPMTHAISKKLKKVEGIS